MTYEYFLPAMIKFPPNPIVAEPLSNQVLRKGNRD